MKKLTLIILCFLTQVSFADQQPLYAVISAIPMEGKYIRSQIENPQTITRDGLKFLRGTIDHHQVISVISGFDKINESAVTSRLIADFHPNVLIMTETSGAVNKQLSIGSVVVGEKMFDSDLGRLTANGPELPIASINPFNNKHEPLIFESDPNLLKVAKNTAKQNHFDFPIIFGNIADGDQLPNPEAQLKILRQNNIQAIAMDGVSVAKLGWALNIPCLVIHSISNIAGEPITTKGTEIAANNGGKLTVTIIKNLPKN